MTGDLSPDGRYLVGGAAVAGADATSDAPDDVDPTALYPYDAPRGFQRRAAAWLAATETPPVGLLAAPTGAGKTAVIAAVARQNDRTVITYPTNALVHDQAATLQSEFDLSVEVVTGDTLAGHGMDRSQDLLDYARNRDTDAVVTNPDVLQAVAQGLYFSPGSRVMEFYAEFDAAVFDEFHYYDPLAASGLLMQIKVLADRGAYLTRTNEFRRPRVLLSSATPDESFVEFVRQDLPIDLGVEALRATLHPLDIAEGMRADAASDSALVYDRGDGEAADCTAAADVAGRIDTDAPTSADTGATVTDESTLVEGLDVARDVSRPASSDHDRFRYPMVVNRFGARLTDEVFPALGDRLQQAVGSDGSDGRAAVVFNSAARSNRFYDYLAETTLAGQTVKDNGYDTGAATEETPGPSTEDFGVFVTTSKGEVGLDYDLDRLVMVTPHTATAFVQRIGRAARHGPAVVDVFGLADPAWPSVQSYPAFLRRVTAVRPTPETDRDRLRTLVALRAARALRSRYEVDRYAPDDIRRDFGGFPGVDRWTRVLKDLADADSIGGDGVFAKSFPSGTRTALDGATSAVEGLDSLRGRSLTGSVTYPRGDTTARTEYDLVRALCHYAVGGIDHGKLDLVRPRTSGDVRGNFPGRPNGSEGVDLLQSRGALEATLTDRYVDGVDATRLERMDGCPLDGGDLEALLRTLPLAQTLVPERVRAPGVMLHADPEAAEVSDLERREGR